MPNYTYSFDFKTLSSLFKDVLKADEAIELTITAVYEDAKTVSYSLVSMIPESETPKKNSIYIKYKVFELIIAF